MSYDDKHKMVLQSIMWSKCLAKSELIKVFNQLQIEENQLDSYITTINSQIGKFNMSISRGIDSQTGDLHYALICISENRINKLSSIYSAEQLEVLKAALELIILKNGRFKAKKIVNIMLKKNVKFPVIKEIFNTINEFVREKYFVQIDEYYYIAPRGIIEFNMYFRTYYKDFLKDCTLCKQIAHRPLCCKHCASPYHKICANRFSDQQDKCISCSKRFELDESMESVLSDTQTQPTNGNASLNESSESIESDIGSLEEAMDLGHPSQSTQV